MNAIRKNSFISIEEASSGKSAESELLKAQVTMDKFFYCCSHTMREPLKTISGLVHLMKNTNDSSPDTTLYLKHLEKTVKGMESLLNQVQHLLQNESSPVKREIIECKKEVRWILDKFSSQIVSRKIKVSVKVNEHFPLLSDTVRVTTLLSNLIHNAIVFSDDNKQISSINIEFEVNQANARIVIKDNGIGMSNAIRDRIFDLFYRGSERSQGSGIGMFVVKEIAEHLKATIEVISENSIGTEITVVIPHNLPG